MSTRLHDQRLPSTNCLHLLTAFADWKWSIEIRIHVVASRGFWKWWFQSTSSLVFLCIFVWGGTWNFAKTLDLGSVQQNKLQRKKNSLWKNYKRSPTYTGPDQQVQFAQHFNHKRGPQFGGSAQDLWLGSPAFNTPWSDFGHLEGEQL